MSGVEAEMLAMEREGNFRVQEWCSNCGHQLMKMRNKDLFCCNCDMTVMMYVNGHKENNNDIGYEGRHENESKPSRELADKRMAELLLMGWTMLADACFNISPTGCSYPLMRSREGEVVCVFCSQLEGEEGGSSSNAQERMPSPQRTEYQNGEVTHGGGNNTNGVSSDLGALLLQGYKMTAENCADCRIIPLMLSPNERNSICVRCGKNSNQVSDTGAAAAVAESCNSVPPAFVMPPQTTDHTQDLMPPNSQDSGKSSMGYEKKTATRVVPPSPEPAMRMPHVESGGTAATFVQMQNDALGEGYHAIRSHATKVTYGKLANATQLLETAECVDSTKKNAELIVSLANAVSALNNLDLCSS